MHRDDQNERTGPSCTMNEKHDGEPVRASSARDLASEQSTLPSSRRSVARSRDESSKSSSWEPNMLHSGFPLKRYRASPSASLEQTGAHDSDSNDNHGRQKSKPNMNGCILSQTKNELQEDSLTLVQREHVPENDKDFPGGEPVTSHPDLRGADQPDENSCLHVSTITHGAGAKLDGVQSFDDSVSVLIRAVLDLSSELDAVDMQDSALVVIEAFQGRAVSLARVSTLQNSWAVRFSLIHRARDQKLKAKLIQSLNLGRVVAKSSGLVSESVGGNMVELLDSIQNGDLNMCVYLGSVYAMAARRSILL
jgi:hypothetical protein